MRNHLKHFLLLAVLTICFTATAVAQGTVCHNDDATATHKLLDAM